MKDRQHDDKKYQNGNKKPQIKDREYNGKRKRTKDKQRFTKHDTYN